jgi:hypothetical protein
MTTSDLFYELAQARQAEYRRQAWQRRRVLEAAAAPTARPRLRLRLTARPGGTVSARA